MKRKIDFDILESLRGIASFYVCIAHCRGVLWIGGEHYLKIHPRENWSATDYLLMGANMLTRLSTEFVIIFFVLSGFSIAHSLRKPQPPMAFYKRRFIRLYPPYIMSLIWAMVVTALLLWTFPQFFTDAYNSLVFERLKVSKDLFKLPVILKNLVYLPQEGGLITPLWSLTHEVIFYLLAPFAFRNRKMYYFLSLLFFIFSISGIAASLGLPRVLVLFMNYNIFFAIGSWLYHNYDRLTDRFAFLSSHNSLLAAFLLFFIMIGVSLTNNYVINSLLAAVLSSLLIFYLLNKKVRSKPLMDLGKHSYTLYITHFPAIFLYLGAYYLATGSKEPYIYNNLVFIPAIFWCLLVAYLLYLLVEKRTKIMLDRMRQQVVRPS